MIHLQDQSQCHQQTKLETEQLETQKISGESQKVVLKGGEKDQKSAQKRVIMKQTTGLNLDLSSPSAKSSHKLEYIKLQRLS